MKEGKIVELKASGVCVVDVGGTKIKASIPGTQKGRRLGETVAIEGLGRNRQTHFKHGGPAPAFTNHYVMDNEKAKLAGKR